MANLRSKIRYHAAGHDAATLAWQPKIWRWAPICGLIALLLALLASVAAIIVLLTSNNQSLGHWNVHGHEVQPTVVLSILATVINASLQFAFSMGLTISWWTQACNGTSISELHRIWTHGQGALASLTSGRHVTRVAIASVCMLLLLMDGPFLQRASSVASIEQQSKTNLTFAMSTDPLILGATGYYPSNTFNPTLLTPLFGRILKEYNNRVPISVPDFGCPGTCDFEVLAPGWNQTCKEWTSPYHLYNDYGNQTHAELSPQYMFWANVSYDLSAFKEWAIIEPYRTGMPIQVLNGLPIIDPFRWNTIMLATMVKPEAGNIGSLSWQYCLFHEALQRYPVHVVNNTLVIQPMSNLKDYTEYEIVRYGEETEGPGVFPSTFGGIYLALKEQFAGHATVEWNGPNFDIFTNGQSPLVYIETSNGTALDTGDAWWSNPMSDMASTLSELTFRTALALTEHIPEALIPCNGICTAQNISLAGQNQFVSPNLTNVPRVLSQSVAATLTYPKTVYQAHYGWLGGALAVISLAILAILPTFYGWWRLGRGVSLRPIEIATAFDAPLLAGADSNATAQAIIDAVGERKIRYGEDRYPLGGNDSDNADDPQSTAVPQGSPQTSGEGGKSAGIRPARMRKRLHFGLEGTAHRPGVERVAAGSDDRLLGGKAQA